MFACTSDFLKSMTAVDILDTFFDPVMMLDENLNITFMNNSLIILINKNQESYVGINFFDIVKKGDFSDEDKNVNNDSVWASMNQSGDGTVRRAIIRLGDFDIDVMITISPLIIGDSPAGYILLFRDMRSINILTEALRKSQMKMHEMLKKDALTGLYNRRHFNRRVVDFFENVNQRIVDGFAYVMFDIDHFKRVNDQHGHDAGDTVLKIVASLAKNFFDKFRGEVFRYGGEEFVAVFSKVEEYDVFDIAEDFRKEVEKSTLYPFDMKITISIGVTYYSLPYLRKVKSVNNLMRVVDEALYEAKKCGRNRVKKVSLAGDMPLLGII